MSQYRDSSGLEVDAIVEVLDGRWAAFEVKLDSSRVDEAALNLLKFESKVDTEVSGKPAALAVIIGTGFGFVRDDGSRSSRSARLVRERRGGQRHGELFLADCAAQAEHDGA